MGTEELFDSADETLEYAKIYFEQQKKYFHLESAKRVAKTSSKMATIGILAFLGFMVIIFLSLAVGLLLGSYWGSYGLAFLVVTAFYGLAAAGVYFFKKRLLTDPIITMVITEMLE